MILDAGLAERFARIALANVTREYPGKADHVMDSAEDVRGPREWHPAFYGSFDWHSCVHMHWLLARVRGLHPGLPSRAAIDDLLARHFTPANVAAECAYLARPASASFERTYGWAWLLELARELCEQGDHSLEPLAQAFRARYVAYLSRQRYPMRHGLHGNSAFGLAFALDCARAAGWDDLDSACVDAARRWFLDDRDVPASWEPSGADFLSPSLMEADLVRRILAPDAFAAWLEGFLPRGASAYRPAIVDDRSDGFIVHLDGLNLSRAWNMRCIAAALPASDPRAGEFLRIAREHADAGMAGVASGDYAGQHWLATFAVLALTAAGPSCESRAAC